MGRNKRKNSCYTFWFFEYQYILKELNENDTNKFKKVLREEANLSNLETTLKFLTKILYEKYNKKVVSIDR